MSTITNVAAAFAATGTALPPAPQPAATPALQWSLKFPPTVAVQPGGQIPGGIAIMSGTATDVSILHSSLTEQSTKTILDERLLTLCNARGAMHVPFQSERWRPLTQGPHRVWLCVSPEASFGTYVGAVTLASIEKPAGDDVNMTLYVSTWWIKLIGVLVIFLSVVAAWFFTVYLRNVLNRNRLLEPVALLRDQLVALARRCATLAASHQPPFVTSLTERKIAELLDSYLSIAELDAHGLPRGVPNAWAAPTGTPAMTEFQAYLQKASNWATDLAIVVGAMEDAVHLAAANAPAPGALEHCIGALDGLISGVEAPEAAATAKSATQALLPLQPLQKGVLPGPVQLRPARAEIPSHEALALQIDTLNVVAWGFVALATTLAGASVLIYSDKGLGFGVAQDFLNCILWGLGLPTIAGLAGATTTSIQSSLNVAKP